MGTQGMIRLQSSRAPQATVVVNKGRDPQPVVRDTKGRMLLATFRSGANTDFQIRIRVTKYRLLHTMVMLMVNDVSWLGLQKVRHPYL